MKKKVGITLIVSSLLLSTGGIIGVRLTDIADIFPLNSDVIIKNKDGESLESSVVKEFDVFGQKLEFEDRVKHQSYGCSLKATSGIGLSGYKVGDTEITFIDENGEHRHQYVYSNGKEVAFFYYEDKDNIADIGIASNIWFDYIYDENGKPISHIVNDNPYVATYDEEGRIVSTSLSNKKEHEYKYDSDGRIIQEVDYKGKTYTYNYKDNALDASSLLSHDASGDKIVFPELNREYYFTYKYDSKSYISKIVQDGFEVASFKYVDDKIVSYSDEHMDIVYLLNSNLDYIGLQINDNPLYYLNDFQGNTLALVDKNGSPEVVYSQKAYGAPDAVGSKSVIASNVVVGKNYFYDPTTGMEFVPNGLIVDGSTKITLQGDTPLTNSDSHYKTIIPSVTSGSVFLLNTVKRMVAEEVSRTLKNNGIESSLMVPVVDETGRYLPSLDLYIHDPFLSPESVGNILRGNEAYVVAYKDPNNKSWHDEALAKLSNITAENHRIEYTVKKRAFAGDMSIDGQFVYKSRLIDYHCDGDGVIFFSIGDNNKQKYNKFNNIYDYDNNTYINFIDSAFIPENWDFTKIIPGLNQEQYDTIDNYLDGTVKAAATLSDVDLLNIDSAYAESNYYSNISNSLEYFRGIDFKSQMIEQETNGDLKIEAIPFSENARIARAVIRLAVGVIVLTVATVVCIVCPAFSAFLPILTCAWKGMINGMLITFATSFAIAGFKHHFMGQEIDWEEFWQETLVNVCNSGFTGMVTGFLCGTLQYFWKDPYIDFTQQKKIRALNKKYSGLGYEDWSYAQYDYDMLLMQIKDGTGNGLAYRAFVKNWDMKVISFATKQEINWGLIKEWR